MSKKHKKENDFCNLSANEQKRRWIEFEEALSGGKLGTLLENIDTMDDDDRIAERYLKDTLDKLVNDSDDEDNDSTTESLFPEFEDRDEDDADEYDDEMEPIPYSDIISEKNPKEKEVNYHKPSFIEETRPSPRIFDIDFVEGTTLIKVTDGLKVCTIDYSTLNKKKWDAEKIANHLSRNHIDELQMFITEIQLLLPNFYPAYIGTTDIIQGVMDTIASFDEEEFVFFTRNYITEDVTYSNLILGYQIPEQSIDNMMNVGKFLIENDLHTSFIETLYAVVTMIGFSTNSLSEDSLLRMWSTNIFVNSNEAFIEQLLEDDETVSVDADEKALGITLIPYDVTELAGMNYSYIRYVDEPYSPIFAILYDSEAEFSENNEGVKDNGDCNTSYTVDDDTVLKEPFDINEYDSVDSMDESDDDYVGEGEVVPTDIIDEDDDPEDLFDDDDEDDEEETESEVEPETKVQEVSQSQSNDMVVTKESGLNFNAKKSLSNMTDEEIEAQYGDGYSDLDERGNRPAPRQSMKKSNKFDDDDDMVVRRR